MRWGPTNPQSSVCLVAAALLLAGWGSAAVIYFTLDDVPENSVIEQMENSKLIRRDLQLYGGKMTLLGHDAGRWFHRHSHGKALWLPIAALTGLTSLVLLVAADQMQLGSDVAAAGSK
jgi:hypothetical protein